MPVVRIRPQIVHAHRHQPFGLRPAHDPVLEDALKEPGKMVTISKRILPDDKRGITTGVFLSSRSAGTSCQKRGNYFARALS